nr:unnamed protein product [Digitaria exilis]
MHFHVVPVLVVDMHVRTQAQPYRRGVAIVKAAAVSDVCTSWSLVPVRPVNVTAASVSVDSDHHMLRSAPLRPAHGTV